MTASALAGRIPGIRQLANSLQSTSNVDLTAQSLALRDAVHPHPAFPIAHLQDQAFALVIEAIRRIHGKTLHDVQILGGLVLASGTIAELATGEGKTLAAAAPAYLHALDGHGVHVMTSNGYLADRDCEELRPVYQLLGMSVAVLPDRATADIKRPLYDCDIVYGNGFEFGFDYLRDQITLRQAVSAPLGQQLRQQLRATSPLRVTMQRGLNYAIVDEADHVMLDDAISPLLISEAAPGEAVDAAAHRLASRLAGELISGVDFELSTSERVLRLTPSGRDTIHDAAVSIPSEVLVRPWAQYVEAALKAKYIFQRNQHYVLDDGEVQIVDSATGRIMPDRTWSDGLHQAVLAKENLPITPDTRSLARITRQRFLRLYRTLSGMTGTATGAEAEFRSIYSMNVVPIPSRLPSQRQVLPSRFFGTAEAKWQAIASDIHRRHATGQPILAGTRSIEDSQALAQRLDAYTLPYELLNGRQNKCEADIIAQAGQPGAIMIATNLAGRGTDIAPTPAALDAGGLHVICCEPDESYRVDRQLIGRSARQGQTGSAQCFISAEDGLIARHAPRMALRIRSQTGESGESHVDLTPELRRLQRVTEHAAAQSRRALFDHDLQRESTLARFLGVHT